MQTQDDGSTLLFIVALAVILMTTFPALGYVAFLIAALLVGVVAACA